MNIVIYIFAGLAGLLVLLLIVAAIAPKSYGLSRSIVIDRSLQQVFDYVKYLRNTEHYSKWVMMDPNLRKGFRGEDGKTGFIYSWDSNMKNVGKGEQEITSVKERERVGYEIRFEKPFEGRADAALTLTPDGRSTNVTWSFGSRMKYPMNLMILMNMDKIIGKDIAASLENLKRILESGAA